MKSRQFHSPHFTRSLWLPVTIGCALACTPLAVPLRAQDDAAKEQASKPQPNDPASSKKGELNKANPGGTVKLMAGEVKFVRKAGAGNAAEVKMAELALKNAESQEVKDFAQTMIKDHGQANEDLGLVAKNHNITFPPDAPEMEKELGKKMLDVKGAAFDKAYVNHAVKDHEKDVAEYKMAVGEVKDEKLVEYVQKTTPIIEGHLKMAKELQAKMKK